MDLHTLKTKLHDASHNFRGKSKETILKNGSFDRKMLVDTALSLIKICDDLVERNSCNTPNLDSIVDMFANKTETLMRRVVEEAGLIKTNQTENKIVGKKHVLVVQNDDEDKFSSEKWSDVVKNKISDKLKNVPVDKTLLTNDGKGCIFLPDEAALQEANIKLSSDLSVSKSTRSPTKILPKLSINNINPEEVTSTEMLKENILQKNSVIAEKLSDDTRSKLDVVLIDKKKKKAILKVTPDIREIIMENERVFVNLESHHVTDSLHVEQCFHCQGFGHRSTSNRCPKKDSNPVCLFCASSHRSSNCNHKNNRSKLKCANCENSNNKEIKNRAKLHSAASKNCPIFEREVEFLRKKTSYDPKNY